MFINIEIKTFCRNWKDLFLVHFFLQKHINNPNLLFRIEKSILNLKNMLI